jgi:hypothetical protein
VGDLLDDMVSDNSGTNSPQGLWLAYQELKANADPTALHIVVFFTDGVPTHFPGRFRTNTNPPGSSCDNKDKDGMIGTPTRPDATLALGLTIIDPGPPPVPADQSTYITGCGFSSADVRNSVPFLPMTDLNGTSISGGQSIPRWSSGKPQTDGMNIRPISINLTVNTAQRMRQDAAMPMTIYGIGLGGEAGGYPADHVMMRDASNDASQTTTYSDTEPQGLYVYAPSPLQLNQAFQTVANEIFRLIQ